MTTPLLEINNLNVHFSSHGKKLYAVSGIDLTLNKGETLAIVGESGCGKSATAKAITKLLPSFSSRISGDIHYEGRNLTHLNESQMQSIRGKEISMIFQDPMTSLNPVLRIGMQIIEGYRKHHPGVSFKQAQEYAIEMLQLVGIPNASERINDFPHTLSGGMRQRVMIALALACKPKILIADEPTTALDVTIQAQILNLIKEIQQKTQTSIMLITHDLSVVAGYCDRVLVMYAGKVMENASVYDLFYNPKHPYTQLLLKAIPKINMARDIPLLPIEGHPPQMTFRLEGCPFVARCPHAMKICKIKTPPAKKISNTQSCSCWLYYKESSS
ncbi:MAG: ABC transporter ATP-binding protein [Chlamydiae bacterium]|nr:ABC transporter ATP-binding protein [Chlamydiota bacterium]